MLRAWRWFALAGVIVLADQATKALVLARFSLHEWLEITSFFNMVLVYNKGAAFSFLSDAGGWQTPALVLFALVEIGVVGAFMNDWRRLPPKVRIEGDQLLHAIKRHTRLRRDGAQVVVG